jgi:Contact-dependent growth inhibition CdiA C-terminal domain
VPSKTTAAEGKPLSGLGSIDESEKTFTPEERKIAELLKSEGKTVRALRESTIKGQRTPDAEVDGEPTEFKSLRSGSANSVKYALDSAKGQAGQALVDARTSGTSQPDAEAVCGNS